jgi:predicted ester cyclase
LFLANGYAEKGAEAMVDSKASLTRAYRDYLECLNQQDWANLGRHVDDAVRRNGERLGVAGYRAMLERDFDEIPDLNFRIELLVVDPPHVACRLAFDCAPRGVFLGLRVNGRRVAFCENVFYRFRDGKIIDVLSVIDKTAIEAQLTRQNGNGGDAQGRGLTHP